MTKRNIPGEEIVDPSSVSNLTYNKAAGAQKNTEVGCFRKPLKDDAGAYTTDASSDPLVLPAKGKNLAVYNNSNAVGSITLGDDSTVASQAPGAVDANGNPGIPCKPNDWTFIACGEKRFVISSAATLLVFLIEDDSSLK